MAVRKPFAIAAAVVLLMAGCSRTSMPAQPVPAPGPEDANPISLLISPPSSVPGATVTAIIRVAEPEQISQRQTGGGFRGALCFGQCGDDGALTHVNFQPSPDEPGLFTASFVVPAVLGWSNKTGYSAPVAPGEYQVSVGCVTGDTSGCDYRPQANSAFRVSRGLDTVRWGQLPAASATVVGRLGAWSASARSPLPGSQRSVQCVSGSLVPDSGGAPAQLVRTDDAGRSMPPILFGQKGPLIGRNGDAICGDVALDPTHPDSYFVSDGHYAGGTVGPYPTPQFTRDGGATWSPVPSPEGFEAKLSFIGFTVTTGGVTAWFSQASQEQQSLAEGQIKGSYTRDGGGSWTTVEPSCPASGPCLWQVRTKPADFRNGLIRSVDGGKSWSWAGLSGMPFSAEQFYVVDGSGGQVLEALNGSPSLYWGVMPLLRSEDGGTTWRWVVLPAPPADWLEGSSPYPTMSLRLDTDGSLLLDTTRSTPTKEYRLAPGSTEWVLSASPGHMRR